MNLTSMFRLTLFLVAGIFVFDRLVSCGLPVPDLAVVTGVLWFGLLATFRWSHFDRRWVFGVLACGWMFCLGGWRVCSQREQVDYNWPLLTSYYQGTIVETPQEKAKTYLCKVQVETCRPDSGEQIPVHRTILLYIMKDSLSARLQCGDCLHFYTRVSRPFFAGIPGEFDYASWLFRQGVSGTAVAYSGYWQTIGERRPLTLKQRALACREHLLSCYRRWGFSGDRLGLLSALTVGYREDLSDELQESFRAAGVSHILALSGMHVGILWGLFVFLLAPLGRGTIGRWLRCLVLLTLLGGFAFLVGLSPSVVRAVVMCGLFTIAKAARSVHYPIHALALTAFFMLLYRPFYLFDVGFQLSFLAVFSILLVYRQLFRIWKLRHPLLRYVWGIISLSLAAQLGTAPLVIYYFSSFPTYFLLANLLAAPLMCLIIYGAVVLWMLVPWPMAHEWAVKAMDGLLGLLSGSMQWVAGLPGPTMGKIELSVVQVILGYGCLVGLWLCCSGYYRRTWVPLLLTANLLVGVSIYQSHFQQEKPQLFLTRSEVKFIPETENIRPREQIYSHRGVTVCLLTDNRWEHKEADPLLTVDYLYLCRGFRGRLAPLQKLFSIRTVVLDASLSDAQRERMLQECRNLGLDYVDLTGKGFYHVFL